MNHSKNVISPLSESSHFYRRRHMQNPSLLISPLHVSVMWVTDLPTNSLWVI
ncbi:hypothetical protein Hanom_Chr17g01547301 [Helianthus anomalus]